MNEQLIEFQSGLPNTGSQSTAGATHPDIPKAVASLPSQQFQCHGKSKSAQACRLAGCFP